MAAIGAVDELRGDAQPLPRLAHAAFEHESGVQILADVADIDGAALVGEGGIAGDYREPAVAGEQGQDVFGDTVGEVLLLRVATHVDERQDGDRCLVRPRHRL